MNETPLKAFFLFFLSFPFFFFLFVAEIDDNKLLGILT